MSIADFIQNQVLRPRVQKAGALVVYDPEQRYREVCAQMADDKLVVVDATANSIESRLLAMQGLRNVVAQQLQGLLVYVPTKAPETEEEKQINPFSPVAAAGMVFPEGGR